MQRHILIVDDDEEICEEIAEILRDEGYQVSVLNDGVKALYHIEKNGYDLVLLDIKMPGVSGLDILKSVRNKGIRTRIIVVTGSIIVNRTTTQDMKLTDGEDHSLLALADGCLSKPFAIEAVLEKIKELVG